uniref:Transmembrane serine protease 5 n=1 Tax=Oryctolagus cuniculus TaxID=9986 RepID=A0A5F9CC73_RABIT
MLLGPEPPLSQPPPLDVSYLPVSQAGCLCSVSRGWTVLGAVGLLVGAGVGSWLLVLHLQPAASQPISEPLQEEGTTVNCSETSSQEALLPVFPKTVSFRINSEAFLLEVQLRDRPDWILVCHEGWIPALGVRICRSLGHLRLTHHKGVNLSDIKFNGSWKFAQLSPRLEGLLEEVWLPRDNCTSGRVVSLKCSGESGFGPRKLVVGRKHLPSPLPREWMSPRERSAGFGLGVLPICLLGLSLQRGGAARPEAFAQTEGSRARVGTGTVCLSTDTVGAVCLPAEEQRFPGGSQCWVSGWGHTDPSHAHNSDTLQDAVVPLLSSQLCNSSCMYSGALTPRMLCAGYLHGRADACQGDSGGPLVCPDGHMWRLVGLVSWGRGCAEPNHPGVYANMAEFLDWIHDTVQSELGAGRFLKNPTLDP